jgi:hypothetical protein
MGGNLSSFRKLQQFFRTMKTTQPPCQSPPIHRSFNQQQQLLETRLVSPWPLAENGEHIVIKNIGCCCSSTARKAWGKNNSVEDETASMGLTILAIARRVAEARRSPGYSAGET